MIATTHLRKGWCPGALRPMQSGDGLLLRVRPTAGSYAMAALLTIAETAERFGSGEIDLTNRGNLQLRGVSAETYPQALAALDAAGLIDAEAGAEAVRNVVVDPLSGLDPKRADIRKIAAQLEHVLVAQERFWSLPGKFGFSFSGSSQPRVGGRSSDIMIAAAGDGEFAVFLDGDMAAAAPVPENGIVDAAMRLAAVFLKLRRDDQSIARMRDAVVRHGSAAIFAKADLASAAVPARDVDTRRSFSCRTVRTFGPYIRGRCGTALRTHHGPRARSIVPDGFGTRHHGRQYQPRARAGFSGRRSRRRDCTIGGSREAAAHHRRARPASRYGCLSRSTGVLERQHRNAPRRAASCRYLAG